MWCKYFYVQMIYSSLKNFVASPVNALIFTVQKNTITPSQPHFECRLVNTHNPALTTVPWMVTDFTGSLHQNGTVSGVKVPCGFPAKIWQPLARAETVTKRVSFGSCKVKWCGCGQSIILPQLIIVLFTIQ